MNVLSVKPYQSDVISPSDYIMSEAYCHHKVTVGNYYNYHTRYYKYDIEVDYEEVLEYLKQVFRLDEDDDLISIVKRLASITESKYDFILYTLTQLITDLTNIYIKQSINANVDIDDIVTDVDEFVDYFKKDHSYSIELLTNYVKSIFEVNGRNLEHLAKHIALESQNVDCPLEGNVKLFVVPIIKQTIVCGLLGEFAFLSKLSKAEDGDIIRPNHELYEGIKSIEEASPEFNKFGFIDIYTNRCTRYVDKDRITIFKVSNNYYKLLK